MKFLVSIALALVCRASVFGDTPTLDTTTTAYLSGTGSPQNFNITVAANSNRALFVFCFGSGTTSNSAMSSATYNSVAMTEITNIGASNGDNVRLYAFKLAAPTVGANTVTVDWDANMDGNMRCGAESWYNIDQTTVNRTATSRTSGTGTETSTSLNATSVAGDIVLDVVGWRFAGQGTITIGASQTERFTLNAGDMATCCTLKGSSEVAAGVSTTMSWTWATASWTSDSQIAFAAIPSVSAGGSIIPILVSQQQRRRN